MKIDVTQRICGLDGEQLPVSNQERADLLRLRELLESGMCEPALEIVQRLIGVSEPLTFRKVSVNALLGQMQGDDALPGTKKAEMWELAMKIQGSDEVDFETGDQVALLKERIGKAYGAVVVGPAFCILNADDPATPPPVPTE